MRTVSVYVEVVREAGTLILFVDVSLRPKCPDGSDRFTAAEYPHGSGGL